MLQSDYCFNRKLGAYCFIKKSGKRLSRIFEVFKSSYKASTLLAVALLFALSGSNSVAAPTQQQIQMFKSLSPQQQKQAMAAYKKGNVTPKKQPNAVGEPNSQPQLVIPKITNPDQNTTIELSGQEATDAPTLVEKKEAKEVSKILKQFGYDLFAGAPTTFAPATDIPIPTAYIVGPGDTVQVQMFGKENAEYDLVVTREGQLQFPGIGPVSVAGLRFDELKRSLQARIKRQMIGVKANITMGTLRSIRVFVLGEVSRPGSYTVSALSNMTNALFVSGGVQQIGSLRNIQLKRQGKIVAKLDLYDLLLHGDTSNDARLQPGDVIFIPPIGKTVGVAGDVKRPAIYELKEEKTVDQALQFAGGLLATAYPKETQLERITEKGDKTLIDIDATDETARQLTLRDGDVIRIYSALERMENIVLISGHVQRPGGAQWFDGMRLTDLVHSINELLPNPDTKYVVIKREVQPSRKIVVLTTRFDEAIANEESVANTLLNPRDHVYFFSIEDDRSETIGSLIEVLEKQERHDELAHIVTVKGNVYYPGKYPYSKNMTIKDIVRAAYDIRPLTDTGYGLISRRVGNEGQIKVFSFNPKEVLMQEVVGVADNSDSTSKQVEVLQPRDVIYFFDSVEHQEKIDELAASKEGDTQSQQNRQNLISSIIDRLKVQTKQGEFAPIVTISGLVTAPGEYPLDENMKLKDLIRAAGRLTETAYTVNAELSRFKIVDNEYREANHYTVSKSELLDHDVSKSFILKPYDHLHIKRIPLWGEQQKIELRGEVKFPGSYPFRRGETLAEVLQRAGGLTKYAFPDGTVFMREDLREREQQQLDKLAARLESDLAAMALEQTQKADENTKNQQTASLSKSLLKQLQETKAVGRLVINLNDVINDSFDDEYETNPGRIILKDGDKIYIPTQTQEVTIIGEIQQATSHIYNDNLSRSDYINLSGGTTYKADDDRIYIVRANGAVVSDESKGFFSGSSDIMPGDTIVVPLDADRMQPLTFWTNITQIVYQLGVAAAAWNTVGVF